MAEVCAGTADALSAVHDVAAGGLAGALATMAVVSGRGIHVGPLLDVNESVAEFPGRYVVATSDPATLLARAAAAGVAADVVGTVGGERIVIEGLIDVALSTWRDLRSNALPAALARH